MVERVSDFLEAIMIRKVLVLAMFTVLATLPAYAGHPYLSLGIQSSKTLDEAEIEGEGNGGELTLGYFFSPSWALELAGFISEFENERIEGTLGGGSLNLRFSPLPHERVQPYLKAGVGAYFLEEDYADAGLAGPGANVGGGIEFFLVPGFSVGAEATWRFISFTDEYYDDCYACDPVYVDLGEDLDGRTFSGGVTLTYHFR